jgi:hypothetical protein
VPRKAVVHWTKQKRVIANLSELHDAVVHVGDVASLPLDLVRPFFEALLWRGQNDPVLLHVVVPFDKEGVWVGRGVEKSE